MKLRLKDRLRGSNGWIEFQPEMEVNKGEILGIYGDSGVGKTTLLRSICGLHKADESYLEIDGELWMNSNINQFLRPGKRSVSMVFQDAALYSHMTVRENIRFALEESDAALLGEIIELTGLGGIQHQKPDQISGGQKQRVALARALVSPGKVMLLDEPLSALDDTSRESMRKLIRSLHQRYKSYTLFVSHSLNELHHVCDRILSLGDGKLSDLEYDRQEVEIIAWKEEPDQFDMTLEINGKLHRLKKRKE